jgi:hypothetical protein
MKTKFTRFLLVFLLLAVACHSAIAQTSAATEAANGVDAKRPWIGITSTVKDGQARASLRYARAVYESGGLPLIVPIIEDQQYRAEYVQRLDALVVIGGGDIPPRAYGEKPQYMRLNAPS